MTTATDPIFLRDAYQREANATVVDVRAGEQPAVALDRTVMYPTGGGQPHDEGEIEWADDTGTHTSAISGVKREGPLIWHSVAGDVPPAGTPVRIRIDWDRRHALMRTHTALHILCGVIWNEWGVSVTGGNMEPRGARMDFEFGPLPDGFAARIEELVRAEIEADRPIEISFLPRSEALADDDLIRTKVNLIPESVDEIRVVDIVGLDKQADGGTHVASTGEVGGFRVTKTESKGKGNKRVRIEVLDA